MTMPFSDLGAWDAALIIAVSLQATLLAYLPDPKAKAFILNLPIPFTLAALAVGRPVDATNLAGLVLMLLFTHGVRWLHVGARWPIVLSIIVSALAYCVLAVPLAVILPQDETAFWLAAAGVLLVGALTLKWTPPRDEPSHRTPLPLYLKLPMIVSVVFCLVLLKKHLGGFTTVFPMVGVIGAYEARHSLWTTGRQISIVLLTITPMIATVRLTQNSFGLPFAIAIGWLAFAAAITIFSLHFKPKLNPSPATHS